MIIVGLTGGIGSGKTTVANFFKQLDIPIYIADVEAKNLMVTSKIIKRRLIELFGDNVYENNKLNKSLISEKIFNDSSFLNKINAIVHPKVASHFKRWCKKQNSPYVIKEAAIIFEHKQESKYDYIITVTADKQERINRVIKRDNSSKSKIEAIINNQVSDEEKIKKSHFVIINNDIESTQDQVINTHKSLLKLIAKTKI
ncbi:dephospho-CoA kinase [Psychroserpens sp. Hel_I_66]|uniref:dephospho-CoA kinase n=1 Tax=Psychroserpens sp. Hel_I_66 TaxID=1250004 RepID=UPI0006473988|nr:dephospho-CoA kinase [Psychroserpens sp. Hel_I_66]